MYHKCHFDKVLVLNDYHKTLNFVQIRCTVVQRTSVMQGVYIFLFIKSFKAVALNHCLI